jgi:hypothetical protein
MRRIHSVFLDCFATLAMTDAFVIADKNATPLAPHFQLDTNHRHCEYPFRTETKKCKDACQETSKTASEHATYLQKVSL